jgi:hypothetical protein
MKILIFGLAFVLTAVQGFSQNKVGTSAAPFLGIGAGPRAVGMGGAFVAVADDPSALYWNPAGISRTGQTEFLLEQTNYLLGTNYNYFAGVMALDEDNAVGLSVTYLDYGSEIISTLENQDGTGETWSASDWAVGVTYSRNLTDRFSIAGTAKMIMQNIWRESATGWALDAGLLYVTPFNNLKIGMEMANFGTEMQLTGGDLFVNYDPNPTMGGNNKSIPAQYYTDSYPLPLYFRVGLSMDVINFSDNRLTLAVDAVHPTSNLQFVNIGGEYSWSNLVFLRAGYQSLFLPNSQEGLSIGIGFRYEIAAHFIVKLDYGYEDYGLLKNLQKFSLSIGL